MGHTISVDCVEHDIINYDSLDGAGEQRLFCLINRLIDFGNPCPRCVRHVEIAGMSSQNITKALRKNGYLLFVMSLEIFSVILE